MTNVNAPLGGQARDVLGASSYTSKTHKYIIPATDASVLYKGDFVKITNHSSAMGIPYITKANAGDRLVGTVESVQDTYTKQEYIYRAANEERVILVQDDPWVEFEIQANGTILESDVGKYANIIVANGANSVGISGTQLNVATLSTAPSQLQLKILGVIEREGNGLGGYSKLRCIIANHEFNDSYSKALFLQRQIYYVGKAGADSSDPDAGKTIDKPFATISYAIAAVMAQSPSASNRYAIEVIDAGIYDVEYSPPIPAYVILNAPRATLNSITGLVVSEESVVTCKNLIGSVEKHTGTGIAVLNVESFIQNVTSSPDMINCSSGRLIVNVKDAIVSKVDGSFIGDNIGEVVVNADKITSSGNTYVVNPQSSLSVINLNYNVITSTSTNAVFGCACGSKPTINANGNNITATGSLYKFTTACDLNLNVNKWSESVASTAAATSIINIFSGNDKNNKSSIITKGKNIELNCDTTIEMTCGSVAALKLNNGYQQWTKTTLFNVSKDAADVGRTGAGTQLKIIYDGSSFDNRGNFDHLVTSQGTTSVQGIYEFAGLLSLSGLIGANNLLELKLITTDYTYNLIKINPANIVDPAGEILLPFHTPKVWLASGKNFYMAVKVSGNGADNVLVTAGFKNWFSGYLVSYI